jgi:hypothetical protein
MRRRRPWPWVTLSGALLGCGPTPPGNDRGEPPPDAELPGRDAATRFDAMPPPDAAPPVALVISEVRSRGAAGALDEFVELYNPSAVAVVLDARWTLEARSTTAATYATRWTGTGKMIASHGHFLLASTGYTQQPAADDALSTGITDVSGVRLLHAGAAVDVVCFAFDATTSATLTGDATYGCEGTPAPNAHDNSTATNTDASIERKPGGGAGNGVDTNDNAADFAALAPARPQSSASVVTP